MVITLRTAGSKHELFLEGPSKGFLHVCLYDSWSDEDKDHFRKTDILRNGILKDDAHSIMHLK